MADVERYAEISDVPLTGPDPFSDDEKRKALDKANAQLEADVNNGREISNPEEIHAHAATAFASHVLALGPKSPGDVRMGDFADEGPQRTTFADRLLQMYDRAVESIRYASDDEGEGDYPVSVWTTRDF